MPYNKYLQVSKERYDILCERFQQFYKTVDNVTKEPIKLFDPLSQKQVEEVLLIREISKELQKKKNEDMKKARQQAEEAAAKAKEIAAQESENPSETTPAEA